MSIMDVLKKDIGGKKKQDSSAAPSTEVAVSGAPAPTQPTAPSAPSAPVRGQAAVLGASPRANLLPPELAQNHRKRRVRVGLRLVVVVVLVLVVASVGGAFYLSVLASSSLQTAQSESVRLSSEIAGFNELRSTQQGIAEGEAAQWVGGATDIDWQAYIAQLQTTLPGDVTLTEIVIDSANIITVYTQSDVPLEGERIATLTFSAATSTLPSIPDWITRLSTLPGFADATPGSLTLDEDGGYKATVTMHINTDAYSGRFAAEEATK